MHRADEEDVLVQFGVVRRDLLTTLESRFVLFEDMGRQMLTYNEHMSAEEICKKIDNVTKEDIMRIVRSALVKGAPAIAAVGPNLKDAPTAADLQVWFSPGQ